MRSPPAAATSVSGRAGLGGWTNKASRPLARAGPLTEGTPVVADGFKE
jgi:hypothetical protein